MNRPANLNATNAWAKDTAAGLVVFLVALPLCLGISLASGAPLFSGLVAGIVGGIVVGSLSGSHTSVAGPAAGLTAIVAAQIATLGSFDAFLLAVLMAGIIQVALGIAKAGALSAFFPSSVIEGLLAAIGVILILKQIPHVLGHDNDPEGDMAFVQPDHENTLTEIMSLFYGEIHQGAVVVGLASIILLVCWNRFQILKGSFIPGPLVVVVFGVFANYFLTRLGTPWAIESTHLVQVPVAKSFQEFGGFLRLPDFSGVSNPAVYLAAITIAIVASLETLLNLEAADQLDRHQRNSPPNRELIAQGIGNMTCGLIGGIPVTSVVVRSSVNVTSGAESKRSTIFHGGLLLVSVLFLPVYLNAIPLAALAAILLVTGAKLASPATFQKMWNEGRYQFIPFLITLLMIVFTDLLIGIVVGLTVSLAFILNSNLRLPITGIVEKHLGVPIHRVELSSQVSFLNKPALSSTLREAPRGSHILLDASRTDYIDPDILHLIRDFRDRTAKVHGVKLSFHGFKSKYNFANVSHFVEHSTQEFQQLLVPEDALELLKEGNERFVAGKPLTRNSGKQVSETASGQYPFAVLLSCIDSRAPAETLFDVGIGDIFNIRVAGNVVSPPILASAEYSCAVAGAKLIVVMGHTRCGAVTAAVDAMLQPSAIQTRGQPTCDNIESILLDIQANIDRTKLKQIDVKDPKHKQTFVDELARRNVVNSAKQLTLQSETLRRLVSQGRIAIVGAMYDVSNGQVSFLA